MGHLQSYFKSSQKAVIAAEDDGFVDHDGVDWEAMQKAYEK